MSKKKAEDIKRTPLFMSETSLDLDIEAARSYLRQDTNFIVNLYRINVIESRVDDLYGESLPADKKFFPPISLSVMLNINDSDQSFMSEIGIIREDVGELKFDVFIKELKERNVEINRGDVVGYNATGEIERYYEVVKSDNIIDSNVKTFGGFKPIYKTIRCVPVKDDVILGL